ncbi:MAG: hypothetical protein R6V58_11835, partial [Planctomycetota bacterium]
MGRPTALLPGGILMATPAEAGEFDEPNRVLQKGVLTDYVRHKTGCISDLVTRASSPRVMGYLALVLHRGGRRGQDGRETAGKMQHEGEIPHDTRRGCARHEVRNATCFVSHIVY